MHLLSVLIFLPIIAGLLLFGMNDEKHACKAKWFALIVAAINVWIGALLYQHFDATSTSYQFIEHHAWIPLLDIYYTLGVDGIALPLILLTCVMSLVVVIAGWNSVHKRVAHYLSAFLIMEGLMCGVFAAMDAMLFYVFWEAMLIPMFIIIGVFGGPNRVYASIKFFLYTFLGSIFMLVALVYLHNQASAYEDISFSIQTFHTLKLSLLEQKWLFWAFLLAFAVKIPMWPVHTWLPDAHVEAPTGGSVILAAIMLKMGGYGMLRFMLPIAPDACLHFQSLMVILSLVAVVYIGLIALVQTDMKKLIAYSSVAHMGFVTLGIFAVLPLLVSDIQDPNALMGFQGAMIQMISHGFISGALFLCIGVLYDRLHSRMIRDYGGVVNVMPVFAGLFVFFAMANSGLPGTSGFLGEFLVVLAVLKSNFWVAFFAAFTLILGAAYSLWMVKRVVFGEVAQDGVRAFKDINGFERTTLFSMAFFVLLLGVWPKPVFDMMDVSLNQLIHQIAESKLS